MSLLDVFLIVAALSLAGVALALVPTLVQLKRTALKTEFLMDTLNRDISPLLRSLSDTATELQTLASAVNEKVDRVDPVIQSVQETGYILRSTAAMVKQSVIPILSEVGGLSAGIRTFIHYFIKPGKTYQRR